MVLAVVRAVAPMMTAYTDSNGTSYSLGQVHDLCASGIGELAQAFSGQAARDCGQVAGAYDLLNLVTLGAVACFVVAAVLVVRRMRAGR